MISRNCAALPGSTTLRYTILEANCAADVDDAIELFQAYATSLGIDLTFQDFGIEMASMPGKYSSLEGALLIARLEDGNAIGCVGLRPLDHHRHVCEMKRLYVHPDGRGLGVGRAMAQAVVERAMDRGYKVMRLYTLISMTSARALYQSLGFREIGPYYNTPIPGTAFLELDLKQCALGQ